MPFVRAMWDILNSDGILNGSLPDYQGGKALFRQQLAPPDAPHPFVIVRYVSEVPTRTFREAGAQPLIDVAVYDRHESGGDNIGPIMDRVIAMLSRSVIYPVGFGRSLVEFQGATASPYEQGIVGRVANFECRGISE